MFHEQTDFNSIQIMIKTKNFVIWVNINYMTKNEICQGFGQIRFCQIRFGQLELGNTTFHKIQIPFQSLIFFRNS